jgi:nucleoside-diphosphate-sugar epimerase
VPAKVLIVGASGLVGAAGIDAFLAHGWSVTAVSRRPPEVDSISEFTHVPLDLLDRDACARAFAEMPQVTHVVYAAAFEKPGLVAGWSDPEQMQTNLRMFENVLEPLVKHGSIQHVSLMQGTKAYGVHLHPIPIPARESAPRDAHENFYWLQEDRLKQLAAENRFGWTIFRPVQVVGPAYGSAYSTPPIIGVYAAICHEEGLPFGFPGGNIFPAKQAADVRLVAGALQWAATSEAAAGEHFNVTNGEVFAWQEIWPALGEMFGLEAAPPKAISLGELLPTKAEAWDRIVARHRLRPLPLAAVLGQSHFYADYTFGYGLTTMPPPALVSTIKIKQAGFTETMNSTETFRWALGRLIDRRILPKLD